MYDLDQEIEKARNAVAINNSNPRLFHQLAGLLLKKGVFEEARIFQNKAIELKSDNALFHIQLSRIYNKLSNVVLAIQKANDAISIDDTIPRFHYHLGCLLFKKGDFEGAKKSQLKAIELKNDDPSFHMQLSHVCNRLGDVGMAIQKARDAIRLSNNIPQFHQALGILLLEVGSFDCAKESLYKAAELSSEFKITDEEFLLMSLIKSGKVVVIPAGFRCYTKKKINAAYKFQQPSMPFDNGFFSPASIASVIRNPLINMEYSEFSSSHAVCIKHGKFVDNQLGKCIKFEKSSYDEIKSSVKNKNQRDINKYLDSTFGYYTLNTSHNFVLAHYNWHPFSNIEKSKGIYSPKKNIENMNSVLNRRVMRMFKSCESAEFIFFIANEDQGYNYMIIDDKKYCLNEFSEMKEALNNRYDSRCRVVSFAEVDSAKKLLSFII